MKDQMSQKRRFRRCYGMLLMILIVSLCTIMVFAATKKKATTVRLVKYDGDVTVTNSTKGEQTLKKDMRLYDGDLETTGEASYAWMSLDDTKACKLDENSESEIRKKGKKIELMLNSGSLYFDVEAPLAKEESLNIRTSTMVTGVRGTCGWIEVTDDWSTRVFLLTGKLECVVINPVDNGSQTIVLEPGNYADFMVYDKEKTGSTESVGVETVSFTKDDIPGYVLAEIYGNTDLIEKIYKESGIDLRNLTKGEVDAAIQRDQEKHKTIIVNIEEKASNEILVVTKDPVWVSEKTDNTDGQIVYLTMPQKAETVQKFLDSDKVRKVMLVPGNGDHNANTLKVDIDFNVPENKTLETQPDVYVEVLKNHEFVVNGTAILGSDLENYGKLIVKSSNTLIARCRIVNNGYFENTLTGHVVLKKTFYNNGEFVNAGVIEEDEMVFGDALIKLFGGSFTMSQGSITSSQFEMTIEVDQEANVTLNFLGGKILNKKKEAATLSVPEGSYTVGALGTDIAGITDTILGKEADMKKYNAASVFRRDEQFHLISLDEVESYPLVVAKVEHGTIIAPKRVEAGAKVTLTAIPDAGYELDSLTANLYDQKTKKTGEAVVVAADNTFSMPNHDVIVGGKFAMIAQQTLESGFKIQVRNSTGGTVTASQNEAKPGDTITLTVRNSSGHELESLRIVNAEGKPVGITSDGDGYAFTMPESDVTITPVFRALDLNVVFYDEDGRTVLNHQTIPYGTAPTYSGTTPTKASDGSYSYSFAGWKTSTASYGARAALPALTEDTVFTAIYFGTQLAQSGPVIPPETFKVTWRNWDGEILKVDEAVVSGSIPRYDGPTPTKDATQQYSYDFAGWTSSTADYASGEALPPVTADITYTARISSTVRSYTVTWEDEDGEILEKDEHVPYGTTPTFDGEAPEKESDAQYNYTFSGWNNAPMPVTGDATYVATYNETTRTYTITWTDDAGQVIGTSENLPYGSTPSFTTTPTKTADAQYSYSFAGWEPAITTVTGNATYKAKFDSILNTYTITWVNEGTVLGTDTVAYGQTPSYGGETTPTKMADAQYSYSFNGWSPAIIAVTGDATYTATYDAITRSYDVKFVDHDGTTILDTQTYPYGTAVADMTIPEDPAGYTENNVNYDFNGWTPAVGPVEGDVTYVATYVVHVTGVSLTEDGALYLKVGQQMSITASITPEEATNKNLTWESSDTTLVSVTPGTEGTATLTALAKTDNTPVTITVTTEDGQFTDSVTVIVTPVTVIWQNADGTELASEDNYQFNQVPTYKGETPVQASTAALDFTFAGWEDMNSPAETQYANGTPLPALTDDVIFKAYYSESTRQYNITFVDEDGTTILKAATAYDYGTVAADIVTPENDPTKADDADYHYTFKGWSPAIAQVTTDQTYTATYDATQIIHVSTVSLDETEITIYTDSDPYEIIATITPDAAENKNVRWSIPETDAGIASILTTTDNNRVNVQGLSNGDTTLTATTEDGSKTASVTVHVRTHVEGVTLTANKNTAILGKADVILTATIAPATASNKNVTWTVEPANVLRLVDKAMSADESGIAKATIVPNATGTAKITVTTEDGSYSAEVTITVKGHTATFVDEDNTILYTQEKITDGGRPQYAGAAAPTKASTDSQNFAFAGWKVGEQSYANGVDLPQMYGDITLTAYYTATTRQYTVTFKNDDDTQISAEPYDYGTLGSGIVLPTIPTKEGDAQVAYVFKGWTSDGVNFYKTASEFPTVTGAVTYKAAFDETAVMYQITFLDEDGTTILETKEYGYSTLGSAITKPSEDPAKSPDYDFVYTFAGWTPDGGTTVYATDAIPDVTDSATYYATYNKTAIEHVTGVMIKQASVEVLVGKTAKVTAQLNPEFATNQNVTWTSGDESIATVVGDGLEAVVTGVANGTTTITVTTEDGGKTASVPVTVTTAVSGLTLDKTEDTVILGTTSTLTATIVPATASNQSVTWTSSDTAVVNIIVTENSNTITLVPQGAGIATITATSAADSTITAQCAITVSGYTVTWVNDDNTTLTTQYDVAYDTVPSYPGVAAPTKEATAENTYTFAGWKIGNVSYPKDGTVEMPGIKGDTTIQAYYTDKTRQYNVTFVDEDGTTELKAATAYDYNTPGSGITEPEETPTKASDDTHTYTFKGWTVAGSETVYNAGGLPNVTTDVTYIAAYDSATRMYSVTFVLENADGTKETLKEMEVEYEGIASYYDDDITTAPTRDEDDSYVYRFNMWQPDTSQVPVSMDGLASYKIKEDTEFKAVFTLVSKGVFYTFTNDGEGATPVLHLYGLKENNLWYTLEDAKLDSSKYTNGTNDSIREDITKVVIETEIHPTSMENAFADCYNLVAIENIENLKTEKVTSMEGAFNNCISLESLDVSNFDTSNVTTMKNMFNNCGGSNLESFGISGWNTSNVTDMSGMFELCYGLVNFDVSGLDTENVTNMSRMFYYCSALENLNGISSFDTHNVTSMVGMFESCFHLESLDLSEWNTSNVTDMSFMFDECGEMKSLNLSGWDTSNVTDMHTMFAQMRQIEALDLSSFNTAKVENMNRMFSMEYEGMLKAIYVSDDFVLTSETTSEYMFSNCKNLVGGQGTTYESDHVDGTYARIDGKNDQPGYFTDVAKRIFYKLSDESGEKVLRLSSTQDTGWQQIMGGMLNSSQYVSTDGTNTLGKGDITKVIIEEDIYPSNLYGAFNECENLTTIENINLLHTEKVTSMSDMFRYCGKLTSVDVTGFDTSRVTDMSYMFYKCWLLEELDLSSFNTSNVTRMEYMFAECYGLTTIYATDAFDVTNVFDTIGEDGVGTMFYNCTSLEGGLGTKCYLGGYDYNPRDKSYAHVDGRNGQPGYFTDKNYEASIYYDVDVQGADTVLHFYATPATGRTQIKSGMLDGEYEGLSGMAYEEVTKVVFEETISPIDMKMAFASFEKLTSFENFDKLDMESVMFANGAFSYLSAYSGVLDLRGLNTSNVRDMSNMFAYSDKLTGIIFGEGFDTSKVENFSATFQGCTGLTSLDLSAWDMGSAKDMQYMFYQCSGLTSLNLDNVNTVNVTSMYNTFAGCEELTSLSLVNFKTDSVTTMESMFQDCKKIETIDVSGFNTTNVEDFSDMFLDCYELKTLDVSGFNTANAEYMYEMFKSCNKLTALDVSGFVTSKVTTFSGMFFGCQELSELDLSNFDTSKAEYMSQMFFNCVGLTELDLSSFDTSNVKECYQMFAASDSLTMSLTTIYASDAFVTTNVKNGYEYGMFTNCDNLVGGNGTPYNASNDDDFAYAWIDGKDGQPGYFTEKGAGVFFTLESDASTGDVVLHLFAESYGGRLELMDGMLNSSQYTATVGGTSLSHVDITKVIIEDEIHPTSMENAFAGCTLLTEFENIEKLKTDKVTSMKSAFHDCTNLTSLNLSDFNTASVTSMENMFNNCSNLESLNISNFVTTSVTNMSGMFAHCQSLESLSVSSFNTANVTTMDNMFNECYSLTTLNVSNFNTQKVTNMSGMFEFCSALTSLDLSGFKTENVTDMSLMFAECTDLTSLNLSDWDTSSATDMHNMFYNAWNLETLDLSSFSTAGVTNMDRMFCMYNDNAALETIYASDTFVVDASSDYMFYKATSLKGGRGTAYDPNTVDATYACIDCDAMPGYFTNKNAVVTSGLYYVYDYDSAMLYFYGSSDGTAGRTELEDGVMDHRNYKDGENQINGADITTVVIAEDIYPTSMEEAFDGFFSLTEIKNIEKLHTENVTDMSYAFYWCSELTTLDLSGFDTSNVGNMKLMFGYCGSLNTIYASDAFVVIKGTNTENTFLSCSALTGGRGTTYNDSHTDGTYAHIDGINGAPGYFTSKTAIPDISGTLTISGTEAAGEVLTATVTGGSNEGNLTYHWLRVDTTETELQSGTGNTYTVTVADRGTVITCKVTSDAEIGALQASTGMIAAQGKEYAVQFVQGIQEGRDFNALDDCCTVEMTVSGTEVSTVWTGDEVTLTITPNADYTLIDDLEAIFTDGEATQNIALSAGEQVGIYTFNVGAESISDTDPVRIMVKLPFKYGYKLTKTAVTAGGDYVISAASSDYNNGVRAGDLVTVRAIPDTNLTVDQVRVMDDDGNPITVTATGTANVYTFTMPAKAISVQVTFKAETAGLQQYLYGAQSVAQIQEYLNMPGVSEVVLHNTGGVQELDIDHDLTIPEGKTLIMTGSIRATLYEGNTITVSSGSTLKNIGELFIRGTMGGARGAIVSTGGEQEATLLNGGELFNLGTIDFSAGGTVKNDYGDFVSNSAVLGTFVDEDENGEYAAFISDTMVGACGASAGYAIQQDYDNLGLQIYGTGRIDNYGYDSPAPWYSERANIDYVYIRSGITGIGQYAFANLTGTTSVSIPESVEYIGQHAFEGCTYLQTVRLPSGMTDIGGWAFENSGIKTVTYSGSPVSNGVCLPAGVTVIPGWVFYNCPLSETLVISEGVTAINPETFGADTAMSNPKVIYLPASLVNVYGDIFKNRTGVTTINYAGTEDQWNTLLGSDTCSSEFKTFVGQSTVTVNFNTAP